MQTQIVFWIAGIAVLLILAESAPKVAGWLLLLLVLALLLEYSRVA
jgi:hypothetical protein